MADLTSQTTTRKQIAVALRAQAAQQRAQAQNLEALADLAEQRDCESLIALRDGAYGVTGATLVSWARNGRLSAFELERGRLASWASEVRRAIEAVPAKKRHLQMVPPNDDVEEVDALDELLASGALRRGAR